MDKHKNLLVYKILPHLTDYICVSICELKTCYSLKYTTEYPLNEQDMEFSIWTACLRLLDKMLAWNSLKSKLLFQFPKKQKATKLWLSLISIIKDIVNIKWILLCKLFLGCWYICTIWKCTNAVLSETFSLKLKKTIMKLAFKKSV